MSKGDGGALEALGKIFGAYIDGYMRGWMGYGAIFSVFICGMLLLQADGFLNGGWMDPLEYLAIVFTFLFSSLLMTIFKSFFEKPGHNKADEVAYYLGTKKAPPREIEVLNLVVMLWLFSFLGMIYLDTVVTYDRVIKAEMSLPAIAANALLIVQLAAPAFSRKVK